MEKKLTNLASMLLRLVNPILSSFLGNRLVYRFQKKINPLFYNSKIQQILEKDFKPLSIPVVKDGFDQLFSFIHHNTVRNGLYKENLAVFFNPVPFDNNNGQRSVRFAQEFVKKGYKVIFVVCIPNNLPEYVIIHEKYIFQIPFNWFFPNYKSFFDMDFSSYNLKVIVNFLTYNQSIEIITHASSQQWITAYDIIDDWEEFFQDGYWPVYRKDIEQKLIRETDVVIAINEPIKNKFKEIRDITVVPNGYSPEILRKDPELRNEQDHSSDYDLVVGSFGYLHPFRFNWQLINNVARKNKNWLFEIIGFGQPRFLKVPDNVKLIGGKAPHELYRFAKHWHVAIAPYYNNSLCKKLNPIKIFDFLYFELPVVVYGCHDISNLPYTYYADNPIEFVNKIKFASKVQIKQFILKEFLQSATWEFRVDNFLKHITAIHKQKYAIDVFLSGINNSPISSTL